MNWIKVIVVFILGIVAYAAYDFVFPNDVVIKQTSGTNLNIDSFERPITMGINLPITQSATCSFNRIHGVSFDIRDNPNKVGRAPDSDNEKAKIYYDSSVESKPNIVAFVDLDKKIPKMTANAGQDELIKISEDQIVIQLIEKGPLSTGTLISYAIFKKSGIAIWSKQYQLIGVPVGFMAMGYCE